MHLHIHVSTTWIIYVPTIMYEISRYRVDQLTFTQNCDESFNLLTSETASLVSAHMHVHMYKCRKYKIVQSKAVKALFA